MTTILTSIQGNFQNSVAKIRDMNPNYLIMKDTGTSQSAVSISGIISGFWK